MSHPCDEDGFSPLTEALLPIDISLILALLHPHPPVYSPFNSLRPPAFLAPPQTPLKNHTSTSHPD